MTSQKRVLHISGTMTLGGAETMIMNIYRHIDRDELQFDFFLNDDKKYYFEDEIASKGGKIFKTPKRSSNFFKYYYNLFNVISKNNYEVIQIHTSNTFFTVIDLIIAKYAGARKKYVFSHNTVDWRNSILSFLSKITKPIQNSLMDRGFSCGEDAAVFLYGKAGCNSNKVKVIGIPIESEKFKYSIKEYERLRHEWGIKSEIVFLHVGRFTNVKNQLFVIEIFREYLKYNDNSKLFLVGEGDLLKVVKEKCEAYGILDKVKFWGNINDVHEKYIGCDCFILPSLYEGFPTVLLEAQASGLPCFISDTITEKIKITDLVEFVSLNDDPGVWSEKIISRSVNVSCRQSYNESVKSKYDVKIITSKLLEEYMSKG